MAALRQAEELADAAALASDATKALPLFYSLSQAERADAAAHLPDRGSFTDMGSPCNRTVSGSSTRW